MHILKGKGSARDVIFVGYLGMYLAAWGMAFANNLTMTTIYSLAGSILVFLLVFLMNPGTRHQTFQTVCAVIVIYLALYIPFHRKMGEFYKKIPEGRFAGQVKYVTGTLGGSIKEILTPIMPKKNNR